MLCNLRIFAQCAIDNTHKLICATELPDNISRHVFPKIAMKKVQQLKEF